jgi:hypothetical protein
MTCKTNKTILVLGIAATIILSGLILTSNILTTATAQTSSGAPPTPTSPCPPGDQVQHWDKIVFQIQQTFREGNEGGQPQPIGKIPVNYLKTNLTLVT